MKLRFFRPPWGNLCCASAMRPQKCMESHGSTAGPPSRPSLQCSPGMQGAAGGAGHGGMRVTSHSMGTHQASLQLRDGGARPQLALRRVVEV